MCIVQDSDEDKAHEIAQMCKIYSAARVVIAATSASASTEGFLHDRRESVPAFRLEANLPNGGRGTVILIPVEGRGREEPLARRAWAFQECTLAPRVLSYGRRQARFFCTQGSPFEVRADGGFVDSAYRVEAGCRHISRVHGGIDKNKAEPGPIFPRLWLNYCEQYSDRDLTLSGDKLIAFSAIAEYVAAEQVYGAYCAGLWEFNFLGQMCWQVWAETIQARPKTYRAPSWSWASINGQASWYACPDLQGGSKPTYSCRVEQISVTPASRQAPFAAVSSASLRVTGMCRTAVWHKSMNELLDVDDRQPVLVNTTERSHLRTKCYRLVPDATDDFKDDETHVELLKIHDSTWPAGFRQKSGSVQQNARFVVLVLILRENGDYSRIGILHSKRNRKIYELSGFHKQKTLTIV
jgi:hypothetical protein